MTTNLKGDRYDTMAAEITDGAGLHGHQRANLDDAIASRLRYEIESAADQRTSVTESLLAAERERFAQMEAQWAEACCDASREMKRAEKAEAQAATLRDLLVQAEKVVCGEREDGALCGGIRAALETGAGREYMERLEKAEAACSWLRGGLSNAEGMLNRGEKARFVASYCREKLSCTDAGRKYMERLERAEREIEVLRLYGNKDCTAMADEALAQEGTTR